jgi:hypothetical protein
MWEKCDSDMSSKSKRQYYGKSGKQTYRLTALEEQQSLQLAGKGGEDGEAGESGELGRAGGGADGVEDPLDLLGGLPLSEVSEHEFLSRVKGHLNRVPVPSAPAGGGDGTLSVVCMALSTAYIPTNWYVWICMRHRSITDCTTTTVLMLYSTALSSAARYVVRGGRFDKS